MSAADSLERTFNVFVSHSREDQPLAERIEHGLTFGGRVRVFTDRTVVRPGDRWQTELRRALENTDVFIVIGSPASARSAAVLQELGGAWALGKPIVIATPEGEIEWAPPIDSSAYRRAALTELERPAFVERLLEEMTQSPVESSES